METCSRARVEQAPPTMEKRRIGIVGFGSLGRYLYGEVCRHPGLEVAFVWNRSVAAMQGVVEERLILKDLEACSTRSPDLIVEVAHPSVCSQYGGEFLQTADFMIGSPTALADPAVGKRLREAAGKFGLYVPSGAFWGAQDVQKMADRGTLKGLKVTMKKHPSNFKLCGYLIEKLKTVKNEVVVLYEGPVRDLCPLAPNNVNTMACAAIAAHNLGFDKVIGCLVADPSLSSHVVEIEATGPGPHGSEFAVHIVRNNPAPSGGVTGKETYGSFLSSLMVARGRGTGVHLC